MISRQNIAEEWDSDPKYQQAFDALKKKLCSYPILRLPDLSKPYVVATDASDSGAGAALCQRIDGKLIVIEYASRAWTPAESRYTATEKECLAMKWAAERWRLYLLAAPVTFRIQPRMDKLAELDTAQMHILIGRGRRRQVEGAEEHPPRRLLP